MPLAVWRVNSAGSLASRRVNMPSRSASTARLAVQARPYWATKPDTLRSANRPMIATGTIHSGNLPCAKPWSSRRFISAGIIGSVIAVTIAPSTAASRPARLLRI